MERFLFLAGNRLLVAFALNYDGPSLEAQMAAAWKGVPCFSDLCRFRISLEPAARSERISFNQIHSPCGSPHQAGRPIGPTWRKVSWIARRL